MGHWAELDENNIVQRVIVIKEAELDTGNWGDKSKFPPTEDIYRMISRNEPGGNIKNSPQYGMDIGILKKITSVLGEKIVFSSFASHIDPIAVTPLTYGNSNLTVQFDPNKHRPSVIMPMRIN